MLKMNRTILLIVVLFGAEAFSQAENSFLVIGAIGSGTDSKGVVLLKKKADASAFAVKVGTEVESGLLVFSLSDRYVYFKKESNIIRVKIGDELGTYEGFTPGNRIGRAEIEIRGNKVTMSAAYKEHLVKHELSKILMQAAAVPYYENGRLEGFKIVEIDDGSIYQQVGLINGDIITEINGQQLSDVSMAVKVLNSLRQESRAEVLLIRDGISKSLEINVQ